MVRALAFLLLAVLIWGVQPVVIKLVLAFFSIGFAAFVRSAVAALLFGMVALLSRPPPTSAASPSRLSRGRLALWLVIGGTGMGLGNVLWNASLTRTTVGASSVLQISGNAVIALYGILILHERCNALRSAGLLASLGGMFIVSWNGQGLAALAASQYFQGNMLAIASGVAWGLCAVAQKVSVPGRSSVSVVAPIFAISALASGGAALSGPVLAADFSAAALVALVLTGLLGMGLGNVLFTESMRTVTASVAAASLAACPLLSLVCATLLLHEPATAYLLVGAPLTCAGVVAAILSEPAAVPGR